MSTSLWSSASSSIGSSAAPMITSTVTIPSVQINATNAAPVFVGGFQTVDNTEAAFRP